MSTRVRHELKTDLDQTQVRLGKPNSSVPEHGQSVDSAKPTQPCYHYLESDSSNPLDSRKPESPSVWRQESESRLVLRAKSDHKIKSDESRVGLEQAREASLIM